MKDIDYKVLCICGHMLEDHHLSYFMNADGGVFAEECEFYGFNEDGGQMQNEDGKWVTHCYRFTPVEEKNND